jgi:hypothetical protein
MRTFARAFARARIPILLLLLAGVAALGGCAGVAHQQQPSDGQSAGPAPTPDQPHSCSVPASAPKGICAGCSVSCGDQQASCRAGEEWAGNGGSCMKTAVCECR